MLVCLLPPVLHCGSSVGTPCVCGALLTGGVCPPAPASAWVLLLRTLSGKKRWTFPRTSACCSWHPGEGVREKLGCPFKRNCEVLSEFKKQSFQSSFKAIKKAAQGSAGNTAAVPASSGTDLR